MTFLEFAGKYEDLCFYSLIVVCITIYKVVQRITEVRTKDYEAFLEQRRKKKEDDDMRDFDPRPL